jgi:hypothetical protein
MVLDPFQVGYFITQVGLSAASFGVAQSDIDAVAMSLEKLFDYRCAPKTTVIEAQGPQYQSVCTDEKCPLSPNSTCADQMPIEQPLVANATLAMGEGRNASSSNSMSMSMPSGTPMPSGSSMPSGTSTGASGMSTSEATQLVPGMTGLAVILAALIFAQ